MVWCKVRMWGDERKRRGEKKKSRNVQIESPSVRHVHEDEMMRKWRCWMKSVRSEMMREEESQSPFKVSRTKSRCCAKSPKCISSGTPANENYIVEPS